MTPDARKRQRGKIRMRELFLINLLAGMTIAEAGKACGVCERTAQRWKADGEFQRKFEAAKAELFDSGIMELRQGARGAARVLRKIMDRGKAEHARVSAATNLWRLVLDAHALQEIERRILALEAQTNEAE